VLNATFSNISAILWRPVLVVEEAGVHHRLNAFNKLMIVLEVAHDNSKMLKRFTGQILNIIDWNNE
jgi:hypothetical protein